MKEQTFWRRLIQLKAIKTGLQRHATAHAIYFGQFLPRAIRLVPRYWIELDAYTAPDVN